MTRPLLAPEPSVETQAFWDAAADGRLLIKRCLDTGDCFYYPRALSPFTLGETEWVEASGFGTVYSLSTMRRGADAPYTLAYVTLDEGPAVLTNLTDERLRIGDRVRVAFQPTEGGPPVPFFAPA